ncbi:MAG TPA: N,N-dimethylformamidase beta subunit family domain-containing protein [Gaiellaceae bacterium]
MATTTHLNILGAAVAAAVALIPSTSSAPAMPAWAARLDADELALVGYAGHVPDSKKPKLTAYFARESYRPRSTASLVITDTAGSVMLQVFRCGGATERPTMANDVLLGAPVTQPVSIGAVRGRRVVPVRLGNWPSGVYFVQLTAGAARVGYATFVLRPRVLGMNRVAIVLPTQTWQAYNFRDDDRDGVPDTWYAAGKTARLIRPFLNRGVPPHFKYYDAPFLRWAETTGRAADYLSDADLNATSGARLRRAYELVVFEGHHEYVTTHEYDAVVRFRNLGGNLMFLSANNFFWKITKRGSMMTRVAKWRDLGRPEAALIGVQYYRNDMGEHRGPWIVQKGAARERWLLAGTKLAVGTPFSSGGIEADEVTSKSPRGVRVVAKIPNLYRDGRDADMTYYETAAGAKVFAAGAFTIAGSVAEPQVRQLLDNLWRRLSSD